MNAKQRPTYYTQSWNALGTLQLFFVLFLLRDFLCFSGEATGAIAFTQSDPTGSQPLEAQSPNYSAATQGVLQPCPTGQVVPQQTANTLYSVYSTTSQQPPVTCSTGTSGTMAMYQPSQPSAVVGSGQGAYYYPPATSTAIGYHTYSQPPSLPNYSYHDYSAPPPPPPPTMMAPMETTMAPLTPPTLLQQPPPALTMLQPSQSGTYATNGGQMVFHCNVMSPSLTSGFSGSGGDCKSTETSSILSTASYSSTAMPRHHHKKRSGHHSCSNDGASNAINTQVSAKNCGTNGTAKKPLKKPTSESAMSSMVCDVCQLPFPSKAVLENHLSGNRHARRVKSQQALKQLHELGVQFHHEDGVSEMRCEICRMSVNSSHQLQAHLQGTTSESVSPLKSR